MGCMYVYKCVSVMYLIPYGKHFFLKANSVNLDILVKSIRNMQQRSTHIQLPLPDLRVGGAPLISGRSHCPNCSVFPAPDIATVTVAQEEGVAV